MSAETPRRDRRKRARPAPLALAVAVAVLAAGTAFASHPEVSLPGSNFEIDTDANLKLDDAAPSIDWASVAETAGRTRQRVDRRVVRAGHQGGHRRSRASSTAASRRTRAT